MEEIDKINEKLKKEKLNFKILKGAEVNILKDGSLDISDDVLAQLDVVGAAVHSHFNLSAKEQTERIKKAMQNKNIDILFHPTGRVINKRPAYELDMEEIVETAKETKTILEVDAYPDRLDIKNEYIKKAIASGVKLAIDSDAHNIYHLQYLKFGIAEARRGWAEKKDIINAWPMDKMLKFLK
jgi:DNA polymerase (family 10)